MVLVMVNPGKKVRDKINQRDAVGGELIEVRDVERRILMHRGYVSDPPPNETQAGLPVADETQKPAVPVVTPEKPEAAPTTPAPVPAPEPEAPVESTPESTPGAEFQKSADELEAQFKAELEAVEQDRLAREAAVSDGDSPEDAQPEGDAQPAPKRRRRMGDR